MASWSARGFSPVTIENGTGVLDRFLALLEIPAWEAGPDDVDRVVGETRRPGLGGLDPPGLRPVVQGLHRFLVARKASEIEATFGVVLDNPFDEFLAGGQHADVVDDDELGPADTRHDLGDAGVDLGPTDRGGEGLESKVLPAGNLAALRRWRRVASSRPTHREADRVQG